MGRHRTWNGSVVNAKPQPATVTHGARAEMLGSVSAPWVIILALGDFALGEQESLPQQAFARAPHRDPRLTRWSETYPGVPPPARTGSLHGDFMAALMLQLDRDRDLVVQRDEFLDHVLNRAAGELEQLAEAMRTSSSSNEAYSFEAVDADSSGAVSLHEAAGAELRRAGSHESTERWQERLDHLTHGFAAADVDGSGELGVAEHATLRQHIALDHLQEEVDFVFNLADRPYADGGLTVGELTRIPRHALHRDLQRLLGHPEL